VAAGFVRRYVTAKALSGAGRGWSVLAVALFGLSILRRLAAREERVVLREELPEGAALVIRHLPRTG
jgi:hypothetical protein